MRDDITTAAAAVSQRVGHPRPPSPSPATQHTCDVLYGDHHLLLYDALPQQAICTDVVYSPTRFIDMLRIMPFMGVPYSEILLHHPPGEAVPASLDG